MNILLIDDDVILARDLQRVLRHGHEVAIETDPIRGVRRVVEAEPAQPFEVVLCDLDMPHMDGIEVLEAVRASPSRPRFVLMASHRDSRVFARGVDAVLMKPFSLDELELVLDTPPLSATG